MPQSRTTAAIIVAAGRGERAGGALPKQYRPMHGRPVLRWSVAAFAEAGVDNIIVVCAAAQADACAVAIEGYAATITPGGDTRTASVRAGLAAAGDADVILIHDAARPGLSAEMVRTLVAEIASGASAVAPALPVADTLLRTEEGGRVVSELDRAGAVRVQTPQAFDGRAVRAAYAAAAESMAFTDDLAVVRANGVATRVIAGDPRLMKLTYPEDFAMLERMLAGERITCVGHGVDAHRFGAGDHVTLCGLRIAHDKGLVGHSDADAGWHALVDAILGALGQGDIGAHFPPSDPQWKGAESERFLRHAKALADAAGARILHVDVTLICERPKIGPHREAMRARTAEVLGLPLDRVSVKATTTERMGFLGREEGLAAQATATLDRPA
ncbi:MAG TPA: bifunctional 2-C-methyl-D-erythritol 4-phosphate cytidylyltransferase/2-C-methyl-D-erythritol 2,4-cyclodiphosphate synthase [Vitreimonas sp.]|nr:bifunctional 2-C-methyl-D-erythritol 4-phosphate cytidylyltransferase/2-C-methyl-D-erythritol 2,4-cyclodiphosphate synthase [Vitreimonas sp.]HYD87464.1 bifunctional 2-C-methyl-D-erythritol 4-phosphate cytidylyltransferase/2-C-methyl-D-erythritol 2,4-cyclodiphosphate synthase [Vitreimonas sp.]